jgi:hypothetical protein
MMLRILSRQLGSVSLVKGAQKESELVWTVAYLTLSWACKKYFGLTGAGIALFVSYIFSATTNYIIGRRVTGFRWSTENRHTSLLFLLLILVMFSGFDRSSVGFIQRTPFSNLVAEFGPPVLCGNSFGQRHRKETDICNLS